MPAKLAQDAQPEPVAALPPLQLVLGQFGQRINQGVYRSIQLPSTHKADKGRELRTELTALRSPARKITHPRLR